MSLRSVVPTAVLLLSVCGCSSSGSGDTPGTMGGGSSPSLGGSSDIGEPVTPAAPSSAFVGTWRLRRYTLDDGTVRVAPRTASARIEARPDDTLEVAHDLCGTYEVSYLLDGGILTTADAAFPDTSCDGLDADADASERSRLVRRTFPNTQTMVTVSADDVLTVTSGNNEVLVFERDPASATPDMLQDVRWVLNAYTGLDGSTREGADVPPLDFEIASHPRREVGVLLSDNFYCVGPSEYRLRGTTLELIVTPAQFPACPLIDSADESSNDRLSEIGSIVADNMFAVTFENGQLVLRGSAGEVLRFTAGK